MKVILTAYVLGLFLSLSFIINDNALAISFKAAQTWQTGGAPTDRKSVV